MAFLSEAKESFVNSLNSVNVLISLAKEDDSNRELFLKLAIVLIVTRLQVFVETVLKEFYEYITIQDLPYRKIPIFAKLNSIKLGVDEFKIDKKLEHSHKYNNEQYEFVKSSIETLNSHFYSSVTVNNFRIDDSFPLGKTGKNELIKLFKQFEGKDIFKEQSFDLAKLDSLLNIRHSIIHQDAAGSLTEGTITIHLNYVQNLSICIMNYLNDFIERMNMLQPHEWKDKPALIEHLFPVQKISAESFKEQMPSAAKTLASLGSYWKGRKPLILNKACILGTLLPISDDLLKDLEIFEMLMGMDKESLEKRLDFKNDKTSRFFLAQERSVKSDATYNDWVRAACRPEECGDELFSHIWAKVNTHLGTSASSFHELVEQMGIARFGHRPRVADVFSGSGQIPFEAARLGCDVYASDLNPIACLLTWGGFNIVGASPQKRLEIDETKQELVTKIQNEIDTLEIETDGKGWLGKVYLYCVEIVCPESGWKVPLLPTLIISRGYQVIASLVPVPAEKRYDVKISYVHTDEKVEAAKIGTIQDGYVVHSPDGQTVYRVSIGKIRGDYKEEKENKNNLRMWEKSDFTPRTDDIYQERLYCVQWMKKKSGDSKNFEYEFRSVTADDLKREQKIIDFVGSHLSEWQEKGFVPDMVIEKGDETERLYRERGWSHWHHLFNPRQLLSLGLLTPHLDAYTVFGFLQLSQYNSRLCRWNPVGGGGGCVINVFDNQALNTLFNYAARSMKYSVGQLNQKYQSYPLGIDIKVNSHPAQAIEVENDIYITDPPYGDAVKYEEITEFFIAWMRKNPPEEFAHWTWDSRRSLAIKGEDEGFRQGMVAAYRKMTEKMPNNGIQVLMFTHQSGSIWADMANIIWASDLQVTAAWYVVTETDSALRQGANVTGTIMLVLRKRHKVLETFRDDLGWEIEEAVKVQVESLVGLDKSVRAHNSEGLYNDADLQMAGYAAALKVLTAYSTIDGKDMTVEAQAPRQRGRKTFVDEMIDFAVLTAVQFLVPVGFEKTEWQKMAEVERFYLKMAEMEHQGAKTLDNYQNFAKAFKVHHFEQLTSDTSKANDGYPMQAARMFHFLFLISI